LFSVVILSKDIGNLLPCVRAIFEHEPDLPPDRIIVVDDGIRGRGDDGPIVIDGKPLTTIPGVKPFVFARNANLGIRRAKTDVILLNDDAFLTTPRGFTGLSELSANNPKLGLISAAVKGVVCNPLQKDNGKKEIRQIDANMAFVCTYLPRRVYEQIGYLDERYVGYGYEDNDYCRRHDMTGLFGKVAANACVVNHAGHSNFRTQKGWVDLSQQNLNIFSKKWKDDPDYERVVDIMYLACNRLEFTKASFEAMRDNTDWFYCHSLWVYDDGSTDGTREYLEEAIKTIPTDRVFIKSNFGGPIGPMQHFVTHATSPYLAKIDNDTMLPDSWIETSLDVICKHPDLHLLGIEPFKVELGKDMAHTEYDVVPSWHGHIGGIGLFRASAFIDSQPTPEPGKYFGFWNWQTANPQITRGFINPGMPVFLLDRMPVEPWRGLSDEYVRKGWQRPWPNYTEKQSDLWEWHLQAA